MRSPLVSAAASPPIGEDGASPFLGAPAGESRNSSWLAWWYPGSRPAPTSTSEFPHQQSWEPLTPGVTPGLGPHPPPRAGLSFAFNPCPLPIPIATSQPASQSGDEAEPDSPESSPDEPPADPPPTWPGLSLTIPQLPNFQQANSLQEDAARRESRVSRASRPSRTSNRGPHSPNRPPASWADRLAFCLCSVASPGVCYALLTAHDACSHHTLRISFWGPAAGFAAVTLTLAVQNKWLRYSVAPLARLLAANAAAGGSAAAAGALCGSRSAVRWVAIALFGVAGVTVPLQELALCDLAWQHARGDERSAAVLMMCIRVSGGVAGACVVGLGSGLRLLLEGPDGGGTAWAAALLYLACAASVAAAAAGAAVAMRLPPQRALVDVSIRTSRTGSVLHEMAETPLAMVTQFVTSATSAAAWPGAPCAARAGSWACSPGSVGVFATAELAGRIAAGLRCAGDAAADSSRVSCGLMLAALMRLPIAAVIWALAFTDSEKVSALLLACVAALGAGGGAVTAVSSASTRSAPGAAEAILLALYGGATLGAVGAAAVNELRSPD